MNRASEPVHLLWGSPFQAAQELVIGVIVVLGVFLPGIHDGVVVRHTYLHLLDLLPGRNGNNRFRFRTALVSSHVFLLHHYGIFSSPAIFSGSALENFSSPRTEGPG